MKHRPTRRKRRKRYRWIWRLVIILLIGLTLRFTGVLERLFYHPVDEPTPVPRRFAGGELVRFQSRDGTNLVGWFLPASISARGDAPTILHVHGNAGNINDHIWFTEYLPRAGFNVFIFDYRGYGESGGIALHRTSMIDDTHAAMDVILARSDVDPDRIGVYGQSLGASIAINVMADRPEIAAAVFESPFASWRDVAADAVGLWIVGKALAWVCIPDHARPDEAITRIDRPIRFLHGTADSIVPIHHSERLADRYGDPAALIPFPGGRHNSLRDTHQEYEPTVLAFFDHHLGNEHQP